MNYKAIVQFDKDGRVQINNLFAYVLRLIVECKGESQEVILQYDKPEQQMLYFGDDVFAVRFYDNSLYLERTTNDIEVMELDILPTVLFDENNVPVKVNIIDNDIMLMSFNGKGNKILVSDQNSLVTRITNERTRRSKGVGAVGTLSYTPKKAVKGDRVSKGSYNTRGGWTNLTVFFNVVKGNGKVGYVQSGNKLISTGSGTYQYMSTVLQQLENVSSTSSSPGCASSCTGLCSTGCYTGCSTSCSGGCRNGCSDGCSGGCETYCYSYSGCGGDCTYDGSGECC